MVKVKVKNINKAKTHAKSHAFTLPSCFSYFSQNLTGQRTISFATKINSSYFVYGDSPKDVAAANEGS